MKPKYQIIDELLEAKWQCSKVRKGLTKGRRDYKYARSMFFRANRLALEMAAA